MDKKGRLAGRIALISGVAGPKGIGFATAQALGREGATLAVTDISTEVEERARDLEKMGYNVVSFQADLMKSAEVSLIGQRVLDKFGRIDVLVNVAGLAPRGSSEVFKHLVDVTEEEWDWSIGINLKTTFNCTKAVLPAMIKQNYGRIVNISSTTGTVVAIEGEAPYAAAKGGVLGLTRALALEVAHLGITVNAVGPGWIETESSTEAEKLAGQATPMRRPGTPKEVADLALYLSSDECTYITGQLVVIDGGNSIQEYKSAGISSSITE